MKTLAHRLYHFYDDGINTSNLDITVNKLDSGKFQLLIAETDNSGKTLVAKHSTENPRQWRAKTIEELVPLCSATYGGRYLDRIRTMVYGADDADYAAHADERAAHAQDVECLHALADGLYPHTGK
jgi:hypothetical protein